MVLLSIVLFEVFLFEMMEKGGGEVECCCCLYFNCGLIDCQID